MIMLSHPSASPSLTDCALAWLHANLDEFEPFRGKDQPEGYRQKALLELAMLCMWLRDKSIFWDPRIVGFLRFVSHTHADPLFHERLFRVDNAFVRHVATVIALDACAVPRDDYYRGVIQDLLDHGNASIRSGLRHGMLELRYFLDRGGFQHRLPPYEALYESGILSKPLNVLYVTDHDTYTITHALFFLTDFGARSIPGITASRFEEVCSTVAHLLGIYIHRGDWDLVGELLLCCLCLRRTESLSTASASAPSWKHSGRMGLCPGRTTIRGNLPAWMTHKNDVIYLKNVIIRHLWPRSLGRCARLLGVAMQIHSIEARSVEAFARARMAPQCSQCCGRSGRTAPRLPSAAVLIGVWLCERATATAAPTAAFRSLVASVAEQLARQDEVGCFDPLSYDPKLLFLCYELLVRHGRRNRRIDTFAEDLAEVFAEMPTIPLRYAVVATLLSRLGYGPSPSPHVLELADVGGGALPLLRAGTAGLVAVCGNVAAATRFGTTEFHASSEARDGLILSLPVILLASLRAYDLEIGSLVLRTLGYLGTPETPAVRNARQFLLMQQQRDGRFGYLAKERAASARQKVSLQPRWRSDSTSRSRSRAYGRSPSPQGLICSLR